MEDLYDEFGNYIGGGDEEEEDDVVEDTTADAYLQDEDDEIEAEVNNQQLMQIDGSLHPSILRERAGTLC